MHASQNGVTSAEAATLLGGQTCAGCHAEAGLENLITGRADNSVGAPQVDNNGSNGFILNAGYFDTGISEETRHNVNGLDDADTIIIAGGNIVPGGAGAPRNPALGSGTTPALECVGCHTGSGAHHGTATTYRILGTTAQGGVAADDSAQASDYGAVAADGVITMGDRGEVLYDANMNDFCAECHYEFHGNANQETSAGSDSWMRHPTDIIVDSTSGPSIVTVTPNTNTQNMVVVADVTGASAAGHVMCLSCHVPHGGPYADLLAFNYSETTNDAGDGVASIGCETCHSYSNSGM
jgi:hypothetical protein